MLLFIASAPQQQHDPRSESEQQPSAVLCQTVVHEQNEAHQHRHLSIKIHELTHQHWEHHKAQHQPNEQERHQNDHRIQQLLLNTFFQPFLIFEMPTDLL